MAEFCKACSEEYFGEGFNDAKDKTSEQDTKDGKAAMFLCEGCGGIQVDSDGTCISEDCGKQGMEGHGLNYSKYKDNYLEAEKKEEENAKDANT